MGIFEFMSASPFLSGFIVLIIGMTIEGAVRNFCNRNKPYIKEEMED